MKKSIFNLLKYLLFFVIGVLIFYFIYRKFDWTQLVTALRGMNYFWIIASVIFGLLSNLSRAMRWRMLMRPMGYNARLRNTFLSVLVMYFVNLIAPRAGEVARCTILSRTDKVPFTKLVGTVFVERLADTIMLFFLALIIFATNFSVVKRFFDAQPEMKVKLYNLLTLQNFIIGFLALAVMVLAFILLRKRFRKGEGKGKLSELKDHFVEGIRSIAQMKNKWLFLGHTAFIFLMWLVMLYVVFLAYEPTEHLSIRAGMVTFLMGGLAMLAPINGGIGAWHFMVYETLVLYGIPLEQGKIFALVAHSATNLIYIILGGTALIILLFTVKKSGKVNIHLLDKPDPRQ